MPHNAFRALIFLSFFPVAWFGGNVTFGILLDGTWIPYVLPLLPDAIFYPIAVSFLWLCRIGIFLTLVFVYIEHESQPQR